MKFIQKIKNNLSFWGVLWGLLALATIIQNVWIKGKYNNYSIFEGVFHHTIDKLPLYVAYPQEYADTNHYGILFSAVIAPFALLPSWIGASLWIVANALFLFWAISKLPISKEKIGLIYLISAHDLYTSLAMQQFNPSVIALIVGAFVFIEKRQEHWATLLIVIGILTKLYGVVGLAFFFFSERKWAFIGWGLFWLLLLFCLPMLYSSAEFVCEQYAQWFESLLHKNGQNLETSHINLQNLSLLGFLQRTGIYSNNLFVILGGLFLFSLPYIRFSQYKNLHFRLLFLASVSMFLVLFSTGTENSTYIIGYVGVSLWFVLSKSEKWLKYLLLFGVILASLSPTDLVPKEIKWNYVIAYALRSVPVALVWLVLIYEMCFFNFNSDEKNDKYCHSAL